LGASRGFSEKLTLLFGRNGGDFHIPESMQIQEKAFHEQVISTCKADFSPVSWNVCR